MVMVLVVLGALGTLGWGLLFGAQYLWPRLWPLYVGASVACTLGVGAWLGIVIPMAQQHALCERATATVDLYLGAAIVTALSVLLGLSLAGWLWPYGGRARPRLAAVLAALTTAALGLGWLGTGAYGFHWSFGCI